MRSSVVEKIVDRARRAGKHILLPEARDTRVLRATETILREKYVHAGLAGAVNDLSGGCSAEDIALITAITAVQTL